MINQQKVEIRKEKNQNWIFHEWNQNHIQPPWQRFVTWAPWKWRAQSWTLCIQPFLQTKETTAVGRMGGGARRKEKWRKWAPHGGVAIRTWAVNLPIQVCHPRSEGRERKAEEQKVMFPWSCKVIPYAPKIVCPDEWMWSPFQKGVTPWLDPGLLIFTHCRKAWQHGSGPKQHPPRTPTNGAPDVPTQGSSWHLPFALMWQYKCIVKYTHLKALEHEDTGDPTRNYWAPFFWWQLG